MNLTTAEKLKLDRACILAMLHRTPSRAPYAVYKCVAPVARPS